MAAVAKKNFQEGREHGANGRVQHFGVVAFNGQDATSTLAVNMTRVEAVFLTWAGAPASDEIPYWADTLDASGGLAVPASGVITLGRTGAVKTAALKVSVRVVGY